MKIFQSSPNLRTLLELHKRRPDVKLNLLLSFGVPTSDLIGFMDRHRHLSNWLIYDSGAYSINFAQNPKIRDLTVDDYIVQLSLVHKYFDFCFNFDSDFREQGVGNNASMQTKIETAGYPVIPVVHDYYGDEIQSFIDGGHETIALGSFKNRSPDDVKHALKTTYPAGIKVHLFGKVGLRYIAHLPVWSCDASSWAQYVKFGRILFWDNDKTSIDKTVCLVLSDFNECKPGEQYFETYAKRDVVEQYIFDNLGIKYMQLMGYRKEMYRSLVNHLFYWNLEKYVTGIHHEKGFKTD